MSEQEWPALREYLADLLGASKDRWFRSDVVALLRSEARDVIAALASERAAHEETRRRLEEARENADFLRDSVGECHLMLSRNTSQYQLRQVWDATSLPDRLRRLIERAEAAESALEHARRELEQARAQRITDEDVQRIVRTYTDDGKRIQRLASLLSCEPGEVVERVREVKRLLIVWRKMSFSGDEHEYQLAAERLAQMAEALAPSRPASEPARAICDKHHTGGGSYYVDECPQCQTAPPASVAEQAQEKSWVHPYSRVEPAKPSEGDRDAE